jgi:hypothetical protein
LTQNGLVMQERDTPFVGGISSYYYRSTLTNQFPLHKFRLYLPHPTHTKSMQSHRSR